MLTFDEIHRRVREARLASFVACDFCDEEDDRAVRLLNDLERDLETELLTASLIQAPMPGPPKRGAGQSPADPTCSH